MEVGTHPIDPQNTSVIQLDSWDNKRVDLPKDFEQTL
jgi:hypothetical protein